MKPLAKKPDLFGESLTAKDLKILLRLFRKYGEQPLEEALKRAQAIPKGKAGRKPEFDPLREIILWGMVRAKQKIEKIRSDADMSISAACELVIQDKLRILGTTRSAGRLEARYHKINSKLKDDPELFEEAQGIADELTARKR